MAVRGGFVHPFLRDLSIEGGGFMSFECPLCNSFAAIELVCQVCEDKLTDKGREAEYYDEYSAYEPIESMKKADGYKSKAHECPHLLSCPTCGWNDVYLIEEWIT